MFRIFGGSKKDSTSTAKTDEPIPEGYVSSEMIDQERGIEKKKSWPVRGDVSNATCKTCQKPKKTCVCDKCYLCLAAVTKLSRSHCHACWKPTCGSCRKRTRYLTYHRLEKKGHDGPEHVCDRCAVPHGLAKIPYSQTEHWGLGLLHKAMDNPRKCADDQCQRATYRRTCPSCGLPTLPTSPYFFRCARFEYPCCGAAKRCSRCFKAEGRMRQIEQLHKQQREEEWAQLTSEDVINAVKGSFELPQSTSLENLFQGTTTTEMCSIAIAAHCALVCYEYDECPNTMLRLGDDPIARVIKIKESTQLFSQFEIPGKIMVFAFPGTHDARTTVTDIQFARIRHEQWSTLHSGTSGASTVNGGCRRLWSYKVHEGFYSEAQKLVRGVPTSRTAELVRLGYKIIFTGHSLGGALAALTTMRHLDEDLQTLKDNVLCVTLGAPLVGSASLSQKIELMNFTKYFHHLVYRGDVVPRLLVIRQVPREAFYNVKAAVVDGAGAVADGAVAVAGKVANFFKGAKEDDLKEIKPIETDEEDPSFEGRGEVSPAAEATKRSSSFSRSRAQNEAADKIARLPFDCYGRYHFMQQRSVSYSTTVDRCEAFGVMRTGGGASPSVGDHLLDSYGNGLRRTVQDLAFKGKQTEE